uniref:Uncharacterized protein n=2 Tax=Percolomonas cosmopolitus TaxID=63605 RepID=A0A7S1PH70_9EUKA|mmetsp:Transcript_7597/g.28496  ORF Transcript_7597/g.28496 Transcript_7597/m.28496 type:complete len:288 (+) Transcript_7597:118-981(+)
METQANYSDLLKELKERDEVSSFGASAQNGGSSSSSASQNDSASPQQSSYNNNQSQFHFQPYTQTITHLTTQQKLHILFMQLGVLVLGPASLFVGRAYGIFCLLALVVNGLIAYRKSNSIKAFFTVTLQTEERAHYMVLAMIMLVGPFSVLFVALMMIMALFDVLDYAPSVFASNPLYVAKVQPLMAKINANRTQMFTTRIPMIELMICLSSIVELRVVRIFVMMNFLVMRYLNSHNLQITVGGLMRVVEKYSERVPFVHRALLVVKKYVGTYVDKLRMANEHLKQM